jgi:hypothetical protein
LPISKICPYLQIIGTIWVIFCLIAGAFISFRI